MKPIKMISKLIPLFFVGVVISALTLGVVFVFMLSGNTIPLNAFFDINCALTVCSLGLWLSCAVDEV